MTNISAPMATGSKGKSQCRSVTTAMIAVAAAGGCKVRVIIIHITDRLALSVAVYQVLPHKWYMITPMAALNTWPQTTWRGCATGDAGVAKIKQAVAPKDATSTGIPFRNVRYVTIPMPIVTPAQAHRHSARQNLVRLHGPPPILRRYAAINAGQRLLPPAVYISPSLSTVFCAIFWRQKRAVHRPLMYLS